MGSNPGRDKFGVRSISVQVVLEPNILFLNLQKSPDQT